MPNWIRICRPVWCLINADITRTHTRLTALFPGLPRWAGTRKVKRIWILLKQETVSGSGMRWDICKSAPNPRQITTPAPHHSVFYRPYALPAAQPTQSKHWSTMTIVEVKALSDIYPLMRVPLSSIFSTPPSSMQRTAFLIYSWPCIDGAKDFASCSKMS